MIWTISLFAQPLILMLFKFSRRCNLPDRDQSPKFRLVMTSSPVLLPSIHLTQLYQTNSLAPTTASTLPRIKFVLFPVSIIIRLKNLIRTRLRYLSLFRSCHGSLRTNRCFDLIAWRFLSSNHYLRTVCARCNTSPSGTLSLLHKIRFDTGRAITIPDEMTIREFVIRNPDITLWIPLDMLCECLHAMTLSHPTSKVVDCCLGQSRSNYSHTPSGIRRNVPGALPGLIVWYFQENSVLNRLSPCQQFPFRIRFTVRVFQNPTLDDCFEALPQSL
jgi:hypothetical protein